MDAVPARSLAGRRVTAIGSGDVHLRTSGARGVDDREVRASLSTCLELGLTIVDVHPDPDSERLVGEVIRALRFRDTVVVASRVPELAARLGVPTRDALVDRLPTRYVQERVEATLRASHLDAIPLCQLPVRAGWRGSPAWPELVGTCERLGREGKVLAWGALVDDVGATEPESQTPTATTSAIAAAASAVLVGDLWSLAAAPAAPEPARPPSPWPGSLASETWLSSISVPYSACERGIEIVLPTLASSSLVVLARRPLAGGTLAGHVAPGMRAKPTDDRRAIDGATLDRIAVAIARLGRHVKIAPAAATSTDAAKQMLERACRPEHAEATTIAELALRYVLDHGVVALPRLHRRDHVIASLACLGAPPLSDALCSLIRNDSTDEDRDS